MSAGDESQLSSSQPFRPRATVNIVTWLLLVVSTIAVLVRITIKRIIAKQLHIDDILAIASLITHICSGAATTVASNNSSFNGAPTLSEHQRVRFAQSLFASNFLFIATICFAKSSILTLFNVLTETKSHLRIGFWLNIGIVVWTSVSSLALGFTCPVPRSWETVPACQREVSFWYAFESLNVVTDCIIIAYSIHVIWPLQMPKPKRMIALGCFGARIFDVGATIVQMEFTKSFDAAVMSKDLWTWMLVTQLVQCISILTSCVPYMRPLLNNLPSGMFMSDEIRRKDRVTGSADNSYVKMGDYGYVMKNGQDGRASRSAAHSITSNNAQPKAIPG